MNTLRDLTKRAGAILLIALLTAGLLGTTPATPVSASSTSTSVTFTSVADAYVKAANPNTNFGNLPELGARRSPHVRSYIRFSVSGLGGLPITQARLRLYVKSNSAYGLKARRVSSDTWTETTINYRNMPALGIVIASSAAVSSGTWITFNVSSYVNAEGTYSFGIATPGSAAIAFASRESGAKAPRLVLTLGTTPAPSGVSFLNDWEQGVTGPGRWAGTQIVANDRFQRLTSPSQVGHYAVRVELRPGDDPIHSSGERAEALIMTDQNGNPINENESSGTQFYAFSIQLPSNWTKPADDAHGLHWGICFQLHGPDALGQSPAMALEATDAFYLDVTTGNLDAPAALYRHFYIPLSDGRLSLGQWVDFVIKIKFAKDFTGSINVWRRDQGQVQFHQVLSINNIPTLQYRSSLGGVGDHYWKYGYYRSGQTTVTNTLLLGALARGTTFDGVVAAAFLPR